jgi:hypothetical protein
LADGWELSTMRLCWQQELNIGSRGDLEPHQDPGDG